MNELLISDILNCLKYEYLVDGAVVRGIAVSDLLNSLRGGHRGSCDVVDERGNLRRWSNLGSCLADFEYSLQRASFNVEDGRNGRNQRTRVVYL